MQKKIRLLFIFIFPALFLQMYYCYHNPEPFPAIMMPRFGYQQLEDNTVSYTDVDLFFIADDGKKQNIDRHQLFKNMHLPQRFFAVKKVFSTDSQAAQDPEFLAWLRENVKSLTTENSGKLEAIWHRVYLVKKNGNLIEEKEIIASKTIKF